MGIKQKTLEVLSKANYVAVLTGAGVSAESGVKTFRDPDGFWAKFNPMELASPEGFMSNPQLVWEWYRHRVEIVESVKPNPGHYAIAEMQSLFPKFTLITQNVDRLHQSAGSKEVIELHGNIVDNHCFDCGAPYHGEVALPDNQIPKCDKCGGKIRPSVVWFGEMLPQDALHEAEIAARKCNVFISVGTSTEVYPAAQLPFSARQSGAYIIEVNPNSTQLSAYCDDKFAEPSGIALPQLINELKTYMEK